MITPEALTAWYRKGYTVFPLRIDLENGKKVIRNSFRWKDAELDEGKAITLLKPDHNAVAVLTGPKYNLFVLDLDNKPDPENELENTLAEYGVFIGSDVPMVSTPSGGAHYYFAWPSGITGSTTREGIVRNLDIRGAGGLVFAPPTLIDGRQYKFRIKPNGHLPEVPNSLVRLINDHTTAAKGLVASASTEDRYKYVYHAVRFLQGVKLSYDEWVQCGMALSEMGESGRAYWLIISDNDYYDDTVDEVGKKYDNFLETTEKITIATLFQIAKMHGFKYTADHHPVEEREPQQTDSVLFTRSDMMDALRFQYSAAHESTFGLGYGPTVNELVRITKGQVTVVTGVPGSGKSNWVDDVLINLSRDYDWKHVIFSPESQPLHEHIDSLVSKYAGQPVRRGFENHLPEEQHETAITWVDNHFFIMDARRVDRKMSNLMDITESIVMKYGADTFVLDPWNEITHERPTWMTETEYISWILGRLRAFALELNIHIIIVAHPAKMPVGKSGERIYKVGPYDISGSANWWNKVDMMFSIYRDFANDAVQLMIHKVKRARLGKIGWVTFEYIPQTGSYKPTGNSITDKLSGGGDGFKDAKQVDDLPF